MLDVERTFTADSALVLPDLGRTGWRASLPEVIDVVSTYVDTGDLRLARAHITLHREIGGSAAGWHLTLPLGRDRERLHRPAGRTAVVPKALADLVLARARDAALAPVARITSRRSVITVTADDGTPLVEVADDQLHGYRLVGASRANTQAATSWRQIEVELLTPGEDRALVEVLRALNRAGVTSAQDARSRAAQLMEPVADHSPARTGDEHSAALAVSSYLAEQVQALLEADPQVRRGRGAAVHAMRIASRRLRSALRTFAPLLDADAVGDLRAELTWLSTTLGEVRDRDVLTERMLQQLDALPDHVATGAARARLLDRELAAGGRRAQAALLRALRGERYLALLGRLDDLVRDPPLSPAAAGPARRVLAPLALTSWKRLARRAELALTSGQDDDLHACRKAAKQTRYAAEALVPTLGRPAQRLARQAKAVQTLLGEHQDAVVARSLLLGLTDDAHAFAFGALWATEHQRAVECAAEFAEQWPRRDRAGRRALAQLGGPSA